MMRVSMPTLYGNIQSQLQRLASELQFTNAQISTGRKFQEISDNPVSVGSLMGMNGESSQMTQYKSNLNTANSWLSATETTLTNINTLVSSTASLAEQMATGTYTAAQRAAVAQQVQQYMDEFMQMGNTRYQGHYILSGYKIDTEPFTKGSFSIEAPQMNLQTGSDGAATSSGFYTGTTPASYLVRIAAGGATGTATYQVSQDGGQSWSATSTTDATGPVAIGTDGVQVTFDPTSTNWVAGDEFTVGVPFNSGAYTIQPAQLNLQSGSTGAAASSGTYTGTSSATYMVKIVSGGGTGTATYQVSQDGGQTWSTTSTTAAGPVAIGSDGAQVSFSGNWVTGDTFTISAYQPIIYQGDNNTLEMGIGRNSRMGVSQVGSDVVGGTGGANDLFKIMANLKSNLEANDAAGVGARLQELKDYQAHLLSSLAGLGAALNRVTAKQSAYDTLNQQLSKDIATTGDTDLVAAATTLANQQLAYQAALQSSSKIMGMSLVDYLPT